MPVASFMYPQIYASYWGQQPAGSASRRTAEAAVSDKGFADVPALNAMNLAAWQAALQARIPRASALEESSSARINELLNPPAFFPEVDRRAAELGATRGVAGAPSAASTGVRLTDEERLKRLGLGQQFLSAALGRNPPAPIVDPTNFVITPYQRAQLDLQRYIANLRYRDTPGGGYGGGGGGYRGGAPRAGGTTGAFFDEFLGGDTYPTTPGMMSFSSRSAPVDPFDQPSTWWDFPMLGAPALPMEGYSPYTFPSYDAAPSYLPPVEDALWG